LTSSHWRELRSLLDPRVRNLIDDGAARIRARERDVQQSATYARHHSRAGWHPIC
jgi:hypothetical protein